MTGMAGRAGPAEREDGSNRLVLAPDPQAVRQARAFVRDCCQARGLVGDA